MKLYIDLLQMLTVTRCGAVQIRDTLGGKILCQLQLAQDYELASPWEPVLAMGGNGQNMYVKGKVVQKMKHGSSGKTID